MHGGKVHHGVIEMATHSLNVYITGTYLQCLRLAPLIA